jgi:hypothetical protein
MHREVGHLSFLIIPPNGTDIDFHTIVPITTNQQEVAGTFWELFPGYASIKVGGLGSRVNMALALFGKRWVDIRRMFVEFWQLTMSDFGVHEVIKAHLRDKMWKIFPVRTGHLFDYVFRTMSFMWASQMNARHTVSIHYLWPGDRPWPIAGLVPHMNAEGHSKLPIPAIIHFPPNADRTPRIGPRGGHIYRLNDPQAVEDPVTDLNFEIREALIDIARCLFQGTRCILHIRLSGKAQGVMISQYGNYAETVNPSGPITLPIQP